MNSNAITVRCPHCGEPSSFESTLAEQVVHCPHCTKKLTVPGAPVTHQQPQPPYQQPQPPYQQPQPQYQQPQPPYQQPQSGNGTGVSGKGIVYTVLMVLLIFWSLGHVIGFYVPDSEGEYWGSFEVATYSAILAIMAQLAAHHAINQKKGK